MRQARRFDRSTVTRAIGEIRALLADRGCAVPDRADLRLLTLADVFAYAQAANVELRLHTTEIQVRRPQAGRGGRRAFVSGKKKQNTMKATVIADDRGRVLWTYGLRPGQMPLHLMTGWAVITRTVPGSRVQGPGSELWIALWVLSNFLKVVTEGW
ncbi:hypothetical protein SAMN05216252_1774 [Actinacidiphila glaucinigra]|uniref:Transposase n=1 Tax=Actinacidiphila glaucinigra TaxID=235986 RepID=A0A239P1E6_9ACTN|nr:hypothetical protein SAMN05216252_1774 [Actinacidiphila glaucinigra]